MLEEIRTYISAETQFDVTADEQLLTSGSIDSITIMKVIAHLEETYHVKIPPGDMVIENFNTVNSINDYIEKLRKESGLA